MLIPPFLSVSGTFKSSSIVTALTGTWILAQTTVDPVSSTALEKSLEKGGFFALVLILLYFYRRDTKWATEFWKDPAVHHADVIEKNAIQGESVANAIRENTVVMHQAKNIMARQLRESNNRDDDR